MKGKKLQQRVTPAIQTRIALEEARSRMQTEKSHEAALGFCEARAAYDKTVKLTVVT